MVDKVLATGMTTLMALTAPSPISGNSTPRSMAAWRWTSNMSSGGTRAMERPTTAADASMAISQRGVSARRAMSLPGLKKTQTSRTWIGGSGPAAPSASMEPASTLSDSPYGERPWLSPSMITSPGVECAAWSGPGWEWARARWGRRPSRYPRRRIGVRPSALPAHPTTPTPRLPPPSAGSPTCPGRSGWRWARSRRRHRSSIGAAPRPRCPRQRCIGTRPSPLDRPRSPTLRSSPCPSTCRPRPPTALAGRERTSGPAPVPTPSGSPPTTRPDVRWWRRSPHGPGRRREHLPRRPCRSAPVRPWAGWACLRVGKRSWIWRPPTARGWTSPRSPLRPAEPSRGSGPWPKPKSSSCRRRCSAPRRVSGRHTRGKGIPPRRQRRGRQMRRRESIVGTWRFPVGDSEIFLLRRPKDASSPLAASRWPDMLLVCPRTRWMPRA